MSAPGLEVLRSVFGHPAFRPGQEEAVRAVLSGRDAMVVLPTGGGKSVCYQVPALVRHRQGLGPTLVVSPLIALMEDQVRQLRARGVIAVAFHSGLTAEEKRQAHQDASSAVLIYCSPERLALSGTRSWLKRLGVGAIAVDEAHCISEWGHDFRKDYRRLGELKALWDLPTLAVTATATPRVVLEVCQSLALQDPLQVTGAFVRPNLALHIEHHRGDKTRVARLLQLLADRDLGRKGSNGRVVVYASTRKRVVDVAKALKAAGIKVAHYHAGRTDNARSTAQLAFEEGRAHVLVATTAFGMGVDLPDVRLVAHLNTPHTLEAYVQQSGRAGRDGLPADAVLLYAPGDAVTRARIVKKPTPGEAAGWRAMQDFVFGTQCRQVQTAAWFGVDCGPCGICDVCRDPSKTAQQVQHTREEGAARQEEARAQRRADAAVHIDADSDDLIVEFVANLRKPVGKRLIALGLRGSASKPVKKARLTDNPGYGTLSEMPERALILAVERLLDEQRLVPKGKKYPTVWLPDKPIRTASKGPRTTRPKVPDDERLLRNFRQRHARRLRWKPYMVFDDATLKAILDAAPTTLEALEAVRGMGPKRVQRFGSELLQVLAEAGSPVKNG